MIDKFKVIRCKKCNNISVSFAKKVFKCRYCQTSEKMIKKNTFGLAVNLIKSFNDAREAGEFCRKYKEPNCPEEQKPF